jgi:plastocyanin
VLSAPFPRPAGCALAAQSLRGKLATYGIFCAVALAFFAPLRAAELACKITDTKNAPVADAIVSLVPLDAPPPTLAPPSEPVLISQQGEEFQTFVTPITVGTMVTFPNADKVSHQVYSQSPAKKFAFPLYKPGAMPTVTFDRPGVIALGCNIHDWMLAYVVVLETPWFAKTSADGTATLTGVPPGRYRAEVWHPRLAKTEKREITLAAAGAPSAPLAFSLALKPDRRIRHSVETTGGGYK